MAARENLRSKIVEQAVTKSKRRGQLVHLGDQDGVVEVPGSQGKIYVRDDVGNVKEVWNARVPLIPNHPAFVNKIDGKLQVTELYNIYDNYIYPAVGPHHHMHEWGPTGSDIIRVWGDVWMPWKIEPNGLFEVRIYRTAINANGTWLTYGTEDVDLASHVPETDERYVLLSLDSAGAIEVTDGEIVASVTIEDIPALPEGNKPLFAVHLNSAATELVYNPSLSDFVDLRYMETGGGGSSSGGHVIQDDGSPMTQRANLNFTGSVTVSDDSGSDATVINIVGSGGGAPGFQTLSDGANISWDLDSGSGQVTLEGNRTLDNPTNMAAGETYALLVIQDATGNRLISAYGDHFLFPNNVPPILSTYKNRQDILLFACTGTYMIFAGIQKNVTNSAPELAYTTNLEVWLEPRFDSYSDAGITPCEDNDPVYETLDQTANSNDAVQTTLGDRPIFKADALNGLAGWYFNGSSAYIKIPGLDLGDNFSLYLVIVPESITPVGLFDASPSGSDPYVRNWDVGNWGIYSSGPDIDFTLPDTDPVLIEFLHTQDGGRVINYYKNGVLIDTQSNEDTDAYEWIDPVVGTINLGGAGYYQGYMLALLGFTEVNSDAHRIDVETYLQGSFGI